MGGAKYNLGKICVGASPFDHGYAGNGYPAAYIYLNFGWIVEHNPLVADIFIPQGSDQIRLSLCFQPGDW